MDFETKAELAELENRLTKTITDTVASAFSNLEQRLTQFFNKDIENLKEQNCQFKSDISKITEQTAGFPSALTEMHMQINRETDVKIADITKRIDNLNKRQTIDEGVAKGEDRAISRIDRTTEQGNRKTEITYGKMTAIVATAVAFGGFVAWGLSFIIK
jgi:hypothetical protein